MGVEGESPRKRGKGGKGIAAVWLVAVQGTERTSEQKMRERQATGTTRHDTAGTGRTGYRRQAERD